MIKMKTLKEQLKEHVYEINEELNRAEHYYDELHCSDDMYAVGRFSVEMDDIIKEIGDDDSSIPLEYLLPLYNIDIYKKIAYKRIAIYYWRELVEEGYSIDPADYFSTVYKLIEKHSEEGGTSSTLEDEICSIFFS